MAVQVQELGELVALSQIGEKGRGREVVVTGDDEGNRCSWERGRAAATDTDMKVAAVHSE